MLAIFVLAFLAKGGLSESLTPLIAWSNSDVLSSVKHFSSVTDILNQATVDGLDVLVIFKAPHLSFDDIVKYGGVYGEDNGALGHLKSMVKVSSSSVWGGVEGEAASELEDGLREKLGVHPHYLHGSQEFKTEEMLVVIELPAALNDDEFSKQVAAISETMEIIEEQGITYAVFYTADSSGDDTSKQSKKRRRNLEQDHYNDNSGSDCAFSHAAYQLDEKSGKILPCLLFCLYTNELKYYPDSSTSCVAALGGDNIMADCDSYVPSLEVQMKANCTNDQTNANSEQNLRVRFQFPINDSFWSMQLLMDIEMQELVFERDSSAQLNYPFAVPMGASYSCSADSYNNYTARENSSTVFFAGGLQVQPFAVNYVDKNGYPVFSSSYNCQGYFTVPSWMGVFAGLVLLLIFYISILFAFSIQSMDQFDDPRQPTISVESLH